MGLLDKINNAYKEGRKLMFVLLDPDKFDMAGAEQYFSSLNAEGVDAFLVGGSLITHGSIGQTIQTVKQFTDVPVCIFPGNYRQIDPSADAILFMSLISGRNPDFLIGNQVVAAPLLKNSTLEIIPTGYMLIDGGKLTTAHYMSNTLPIPADKPEIAACTALAGQMLGMKCIYADAGSGASNPLSVDFVKTLSSYISIPLIAGGGIKDAETAKNILNAGATAIVIGNAAEQSPQLIRQIIQTIQ